MELQQSALPSTQVLELNFPKFGIWKTELDLDKAQTSLDIRPQQIPTALWVGALQGGLDLFTEGFSLKGKEAWGYFLFLPAQQALTISLDPGISKHWVAYQMDWSLVYPNDASLPSPTMQQLDGSVQLLTRRYLSPTMVYLCHEIREHRKVGPLDPYFAYAKGAEWLWKWHQSTQQQASRPNLKPHEETRIVELCALLQKHPENPYKLIDLAHEIGTNDATLKKHFKLVTGMTVFSYLTSCRMEKAKALLKTDAKIGDIANMIGYQHATHFSAAFAKYTGLSPIEWKEMNGMR